jgi:hypothetical protein
MSTDNPHAEPTAAELEAFRAWKATQPAQAIPVEPPPVPVVGHVEAAEHRHGPGAPRCGICGGPLLVGGRLCANKSHPQPMAQGSAPPVMTRENSPPEIVGRAHDMGRKPERRTHAAPPAQPPAEKVTPHVVIDPTRAQDEEAPHAPRTTGAGTMPEAFAEFIDPEKIAQLEDGPVKTGATLIHLFRTDAGAQKVLSSLADLVRGK